MKAKMEFVSSNQRIPFRCQKCAKCCRELEDSLMLEPLDVFRLTQYMMKTDTGIEGAEDVLGRYAHPNTLNGYPIFQVNTIGADHTCVFLKEGRCSVYDARPMVCRMYPFGVAPGERGKAFNYYLSTERGHHFGNGSVRVKDWFSDNLSRDAKDFYKEEYKVLPVLGRTIKRIGEKGFARIAFQLLYYLYYGYDYDKPFVPQYSRNMEALCKALEKETGREELCSP